MKSLFTFLALISFSFLMCKKKDQLIVSKENPDVVSPVNTNGKISLQNANIYFEIDPAVGARISSVKVSGKEVLYVNTSQDNWGSTFWPSPQSLWGWPPPANLNNNPYSVTKNTAEAILQSGPAYIQGNEHSILKTFSANTSDTSITVAYGIKNEGASESSIAPWEITRFPSGGLVFFPKGSGGINGTLSPLLKDSLNILWFDYDSTTVPATGTPKLFADGAEGWLAYIDNDRTLVLKKFEDVAPSSAAPTEAEIELYTAPDKTYYEVEQQGAFKTLNAHTSLNWKVIWYVRTIPAGISIQTGNQDLLNYVRSIVQ